MECGRRKEWSPAGTRGVERMKGENGIWKSARDIILMASVPTSDVVI
jgi:hypothetical protein